MKIKSVNSITKYLYYILLIVCILIISIILYGYNSGSCKRNKKYICNNDFCLHKEFKIFLDSSLKQQINNLLLNEKIQKRVTINIQPEIIFNCALPNKSGTTITTQNILKYAPELIEYYQTNLCNIISEKIGLKLYPTDLNLPTTCAVLIYEKEGDWINWHYDYNYYNGRFFTVLIPISNEQTCTEFQFKDKNDETKSINLIDNNAICFEGDFLYHRASKLCKNQKRVVLSCQYVTNNEMTFINKLRIKLKDFAYTGKI
jgi:hypothetical protein